MAVLAVLAHHAFPRQLPGGFVGVDIFFVISGHVIGTHLLGRLTRGQFSIGDFYARRLRRLAPALALVLLACWGFGFRWLTNEEFAQLGRHVWATALLSNNLVLLGESGYFDAQAISKPLLHLWSLALEEQFYLLLPLLLWIGVRSRQRLLAWVARLAAVSLLWTLLFAGLHPVGSFYLLHTRVWELGAGVILAWLSLPWTNPGQWVWTEGHLPLPRIERQAWLLLLLFAGTVAALSLAASPSASSYFGIAGTLLVCGASAVALLERLPKWDGLGTALPLAAAGVLVASLLLASPNDWPGAQTVWVVAGTLALLLAPKGSWVTRFLSCRGMVFIGGISYPLYLWHWPLLVAHHLLDPTPSTAEVALVLCVSGLLAWLTRVLVEDPVRYGRVLCERQRRPSLAWVAAPIVLVGLLGWLTTETHGLPGRHSGSVRELAAWSARDTYNGWRTNECYHYLNNANPYHPACTPGRRPGVPIVLLWGDSHAAHLYPGLAELAAVEGFALAQWTMSSCPPTAVAVRGEARLCAERRTRAEADLRLLRPDVALIAGAWGLYEELGATQRETLQALGSGITLLREAGVQRIVVVGPGPLWIRSQAADLYRSIDRTGSRGVPQRFGKPSQAIVDLDAALASHVTSLTSLGVEYVSLLRTLCNDEGCLTVGDPGRTPIDLLFLDRDHLTASGSRLVTRAIRPHLLPDRLR